MTQELPFRIAAGAVILAMMPIGLPYRIRAARTGERISRRGEGPVIMVGLRLGAILWGALLVAWLVDPRWLPGPRLNLPDSLRLLGAGLAALTLPLMWWVFSSLGMNVTDTVVVRSNATLVRHGPYRHLRHPMYVCAVLFHLAFVLLTSSAWIAAVGVLSLVFLVLRTPIEEARLLERFGDEYRTYARSTPRFLPRPGGR